MQITNKLTRMVSTCLATTTAGALAGDFSDTTTSIKEDAGGGAGDWCESLQDIGSLYKNKKNPWIQEIEVYGRVHQQWGYVDGQDNGRDFSGDGDELRRLRAGTDIEFLDGFTLHAQFNFPTVVFGIPAFDTPTTTTCTFPTTLETSVRLRILRWDMVAIRSDLAVKNGALPRRSKQSSAQI